MTVFVKCLPRWRLAAAAVTAASLAVATTESDAVSMPLAIGDFAAVSLPTLAPISLAWVENPFPAIIRWLDHPVPSAVVAASQGIIRSSRAIYTFAVNTLDYKVSLNFYDKTTEDYYVVRSQVHLRAAKRILWLCESNRGFYTKAGQFLASLQHMPAEYVATLSVLQDKASFWPFRKMQNVFLQEFGKSARDLYEEFDEQPIAAASLAQVHHAWLKDGNEVAVKVQYPGLQQQFEIDISTMAFLSKCVAWLFPEYQFEWIVPEFRENLSRELDFIQEGKNAERTSNDFKNQDDVKIPAVYWEITTKRVLTMEFVRGCKVDDAAALETAGLDPKEVAGVLLEVFAKMIFCHGYVHGDPHPGNILVEPYRVRTWSGRKLKFHLILLDHGLYRELDETFRADFCRLWKALIMLDPIEMQHAGERLGAGEYAKYLPVIFTGRTVDSKSGFGQGMSNEERARLKEEVQRFTMGDISQFMEALPRDFLMVLRTDGLLRNITSKLGAPPRLRLIINAKHAVTGLAMEQRGEPGWKTQGLLVSVKARLEYANLRLRLDVLCTNPKTSIENVFDLSDPGYCRVHSFGPQLLVLEEVSLAIVNWRTFTGHNDGIWSDGTIRCPDGFVVWATGVTYDHETGDEPHGKSVPYAAHRCGFVSECFTASRSTLGKVWIDDNGILLTTWRVVYSTCIMRLDAAMRQPFPQQTYKPNNGCGPTTFSLEVAVIFFFPGPETHWWARGTDSSYIHDKEKRIAASTRTSSFVSCRAVASMVENRCPRQIVAMEARST